MKLARRCYGGGFKKFFWLALRVGFADDMEGY